MNEPLEAKSEETRVEERFPNDGEQASDKTGSGGLSRVDSLAPGEAKQDKVSREEVSLVGAPPQYEFKPPEGMSITPEIRAEIEPVFRELNLSDHGVAKLMPLAAKMMDRNLTAIESDHSKLKAQWAKDVKADPALGGANWGKTERNIVAVLDAGKATPEFRKLLDHTGLGSHPEFVRFFNTVGSRLRSTQSVAKPADRGSARFPEN